MASGAVAQVVIKSVEARVADSFNFNIHLHLKVESRKKIYSKKRPECTGDLADRQNPTVRITTLFVTRRPKPRSKSAVLPILNVCSEPMVGRMGSRKRAVPCSVRLGPVVVNLCARPPKITTFGGPVNPISRRIRHASEPASLPDPRQDHHRHARDAGLHGPVKAPRADCPRHGPAMCRT